MATNAPIWREIYRNLEHRIEERQLRPGDKLPTEYQLSHEFMVNRHTVRRALAQLQERGLVESTQGRGSFVRWSSSPIQLDRHPRFSDAVRRDGRVPSTRTLKLNVRPADAKAAEELDLKTGSPMIYLERLRFVDGEPVGLSIHCFSFERFPTFIKMYQARGSITQTLIDSGVPNYTRKRTVISARPATVREAELMHLPRHVSLLIRRYLNIDGLGKPLEYGEASGAGEVVVEFPETISP
jgi:GntR family transcriptional regulator, phosphonate transport system regulatory protein